MTRDCQSEADSEPVDVVVKSPPTRNQIELIGEGVADLVTMITADDGQESFGMRSALSRPASSRRHQARADSMPVARAIQIWVSSRRRAAARSSGSPGSVVYRALLVHCCGVTDALPILLWKYNPHSRPPLAVAEQRQRLAPILQ